MDEIRARPQPSELRIDYDALATSRGVTTMRTLALFVAAATSFLVVLGFAVRNEDLKFAGLIGLVASVLIVLTRLLVKMRREGR